MEAELARVEALRVAHEADKAQAAVNRQAPFVNDYEKPKHKVAEK